MAAFIDDLLMAPRHGANDNRNMATRALICEQKQLLPMTSDVAPTQIDQNRMVEMVASSGRTASERRPQLHISKLHGSGRYLRRATRAFTWLHRLLLCVVADMALIWRKLAL